MAEQLSVLRTRIYLSYSLQSWITNATHASLHLSHLLWSSWRAMSAIDLDHWCQISRHHLHEPKAEGASELYTWKVDSSIRGVDKPPENALRPEEKADYRACDASRCCLCRMSRCCARITSGWSTGPQPSTVAPVGGRRGIRQLSERLEYYHDIASNR